MQLPIALIALASLHSFTPSQVKDDLDAHPWRPAPSEPAAPKPAPAAVVAAAAKPQASPATNAPKAVEAAPPAAVGTPAGAWQLQLAALSSLEAAKNEQKRLEKIVGTGKIEILSEGAVHRLRFGAFATKEAAEAAREDLRTKGAEGFPVRKP